MIKAIFAFLFSFLFAIALGLPLRLVIPAGITGLVGYLAFTYSQDYFAEVLATFLGSCAITLAANILARFYKAPVTVFLIPGIMILVPGADIYNSIYQAFLGTTSMASYYMTRSIKLAGMLALGIFLVDSIFVWIKRIKVEGLK